jgi:LysR family transcriptional activator of glutamate synthase operon
MEIETLGWLVAVADGRTVSETAEAFHTTQPAVTRGLHRLATQFEVPLTERVGRRLRLTFAGEIVASTARRVLRELDAATRAVGEANDPDSGTVRLGFLNPLGVWLVPRLLVDFHAHHPRVRFELRHDGLTRNLQALIDGELDLLLTAAPDRSDVSWEPLFREELMLAVPRAHRLAGRRSVKVDQLADESWVLFPHGHGLRRHAEEICAAAGFAPEPAFEGHDLSTLFALIAAGSGVGLFPVNPPPPASVRQIRLQPRLIRTVGLAVIPRRVRPRSADVFADFVRERATGLDPTRWAEDSGAPK